MDPPVSHSLEDAPKRARGPSTQSSRGTITGHDFAKGTYYYSSLGRRSNTRTEGQDFRDRYRTIYSIGHGTDYDVWLARDTKYTAPSTPAAVPTSPSN